MRMHTGSSLQGRILDPAAAALVLAAAVAAIAVPVTVALAGGEPAARETSAGKAGVAAGTPPGGQAVMAEPTTPAAAEPLRLLFIHHSVGGQLLADPGPLEGGADRASGQYCIHRSHPNGGGLRRLLNEAGFSVHEVSYGSQLGEDTDIRHWPPKFRDRMEDILRADLQDRPHADGGRNRIVVFKSCYPNNAFRGPGKEPGDPAAPELTVANAQAAYRALLPLLRQQPDVLFVAFSAPPLAEPRAYGLRQKFQFWREGRAKAGALARRFNAWLADRQSGWLAGYDLPNVVVFDYYDVLTDRGRTDWSAYPTQGGRDSHPSAEGQAKAAAAFVPFLQQAVRGMGWETAATAAATP